MEVIELSSDSNDSLSFTKVKMPEATGCDISIEKFSAIRSAHDISDDDYDFPEVPFAPKPVERIQLESEPSFSKATSKSNDNIEEKLLNKYLVTQPASKPTAVAKNKSRLDNYDKELLRIQKLKSAEEAARKKAERAVIAERLKSMKPGECMKYMKVIIDSGCQDLDFFDSLVKELQSFELEYHVKSQIIPNSITWKRTTQEYRNLGEKSFGRDSVSEENQILIIWDYTEAVKRVADGTFVASVLSINQLTPGKVATLIIYGTEKYFRQHTNLKKWHFKNQCQGNVRDMAKHRGSKAFQNLPVISEKEFELCLTEIQVNINCNNQLVETPQQLGLLIHQYTKAIAEAPFKIEKKQAQSQFDWYSPADNKDSVRVDKDGNGLKRLWQQQLCQFNLAKLETAEAIISQYPTPSSLMEAYANCTPSEGAKLLQDIAIRRTAGPLTAIRRIGPELSKKLYVMFTTEDGDILLGNG